MAKVLIVDDSMFMRQVLRNILTRAGHEVVGEAETGEKALQELKKIKPDLITLDLVMPGMGGMEALRKMKAGAGGPKVLVVSAVGQQAEITQAISLGASDYLVKPFDEGQVVRTVQGVLK